MKVIDAYWFSQMGNVSIIGIVKVFDEFDGDKYFIGTAPGDDKEEDQRHIADTGAKFPKEVGDLLFLI